MSLKEQIQQDLNSAIKGKKKIEVSTLRMLNAQILNKEKEKRYKLSKQKPDFNEKELEKESQLTDEETIQVVMSEIKKRKESILQFERGGRRELAKKEKKEIETLKKYMPEQLSEEEIRELVKKTIEEIGVKGVKEMGKVMAEIMPKVKGRAEGGTVTKIVKELLTPKEE